MNKKYFDDLIRAWIRSGEVKNNDNLSEKAYDMLLEISEVKSILRSECEIYDSLNDSYICPELENAVTNLKDNNITKCEAINIIGELYKNAHDYIKDENFDKISIRRKLQTRKNANEKFEILSDFFANGIPERESNRKLKSASERFERKISHEIDNRYNYEI